MSEPMADRPFYCDACQGTHMPSFRRCTSRSDVNGWSLAPSAAPTTPEPCDKCAHRDVPAWVKPCVDCVSGGAYVNFREPVVELGVVEFDPKLKRPAFGDSVQVKIDPNGEWVYVDHTAVDWSNVYRWRLGPGPVRTTPAEPAPLDVQVGGGHYKGMKIQPVEYIHANGLGYLEGNVIKYISRHGSKNGAEDVRKALHYSQLILQLQYGEKAP